MRRGKVNFMVLLTLLLIHQCSSAIPMPREERSASADYRLPTSITPENYNLEITTNLNDTDGDGFTFSGVVEIIVSFLIILKIKIRLT